jgi:F420-0:gamma-glutamyl ligase-like protein
VLELVVETVETTGRLVAELTDPDDAKLLVLARAHRARAGSDTGAAVRDTDGRTYSAVDIDLTSLRLSALQLAVAVAAGSGVKGLEAAVVVGAPVVGPEDLAAVRDFAGAGVPIHVADVAGQVASSVTT